MLTARLLLFPHHLGLELANRDDAIVTQLTECRTTTLNDEQAIDDRRLDSMSYGVRDEFTGTFIPRLRDWCRE